MAHTSGPKGLSNESSKIISAIADYCVRYANDPNLFPRGQDSLVVEVPVISITHEVTTEELQPMHRHPRYWGVNNRQIMELN